MRQRINHFVCSYIPYVPSHLKFSCDKSRKYRKRKPVKIQRRKNPLFFTTSLRALVRSLSLSRLYVFSLSGLKGFVHELFLRIFYFLAHKLRFYFEYDALWTTINKVLTPFSLLCIISRQHF